VAKPSIHVFAFQPFSSRTGFDTVLGLRFSFDRDLVELLKEALRNLKPGFPGSPGGWLPEHRAWFVERAVWPAVSTRLRAAGCDVVAEAGAGENGGGPEPPQPPPSEAQRN
jgi:hypothetical protein